MAVFDITMANLNVMMGGFFFTFTSNGGQYGIFFKHHYGNFKRHKHDIRMFHVSIKKTCNKVVEAVFVVIWTIFNVVRVILTIVYPKIWQSRVCLCLN